MPIDIELFQPKGADPDLVGKRLSLDNGGVYWYLYPMFEKLSQRSGQMIDLYADAKFTKANIGLLDDALVKTLVDLVGNQLLGNRRQGCEPGRYIWY